MDYQVVYDFSQQSYAWWWLAIPLFLVLGFIVILQRQREMRLPLPARSIGALAAGLGLVFSLCFGLLAFGGSFANYWQNQQVLQQGRAKVVEGVVEDFSPQPRGDNGVESFTVNGVKFDYSVAEITAGFNNSSTHGGPIDRNGLQVRIHYTTDASTGRNTILKLELKP